MIKSKKETCEDIAKDMLIIKKQSPFVQKHIKPYPIMPNYFIPKFKHKILT